MLPDGERRTIHLGCAWEPWELVGFCHTAAKHKDLVPCPVGRMACPFSRPCCKAVTEDMWRRKLGIPREADNA